MKFKYLDRVEVTDKKNFYYNTQGYAFESEGKKYKICFLNMADNKFTNCVWFDEDQLIAKPAQENKNGQK